MDLGVFEFFIAILALINIAVSIFLGRRKDLDTTQKTA